MKTKRLWVVAIDGERARFFERDVEGRVQELKTHMLKASPAPVERDRAPRVHDRFGASRHRIEARITPHLAREHEFLRSVIAALERRLAEDAFDEIVLSAPPRAAGFLRAQLPEALASRVRAFWTKDLTKQTPRDVEARLQASRAD